MLERLTDDSVRALVLARASAQQDGRGSIEPAHLIEALLRIAPAGVSTDWRAGRAVEPIPKYPAVLQIGPPEPAPNEIPFSDTVKRLLNEAAAQADGLGHRRILPEHLLLALLRESDSFAAHAVREAGVELQTLTERLRSERQ